MRFQIQFKNNTLTLPSLIWLIDFLTKHRGMNNACEVAAMIQSGITYQDKEIRIVMIKGE